MTTRTIADNTRPPIINTITIKHFSKLDFQSKHEVNNRRPMPEIKCMLQTTGQKITRSTTVLQCTGYGWDLKDSSWMNWVGPERYDLNQSQGVLVMPIEASLSENIMRMVNNQLPWEVHWFLHYVGGGNLTWSGQKVIAGDLKAIPICALGLWITLNLKGCRAKYQRVIPTVSSWCTVPGGWHLVPVGIK